MKEVMIPLMKPDIRAEDISAVVKVLQSGMLVQGENVAILEKNGRELVQTNHACAVSNGTASLHLALLALDIKPGDEVIVPAFSYVATANVVELVGAKCVFADIDSETFTIDVDQIESLVSKRTRAIIPVHEFGLCADMVTINKVAKLHNLYVIEDAACALGASQDDKMAGSFGHFGSFSFHPRKAITSGEGGLLTTQDESLDYKVRMLRNHGIAPGSFPLDFEEAGLNYRMTDFQAALLNSQFVRLQKTIEYKNALAKRYRTELALPFIKLPSVPSDRKHTWQTYHIMLDSETNRNSLMQYLKERGIHTNYGAQCIPAMTYYSRKYGFNSSELFPNAWAAYTRGLALPFYELLTPDQVSYIFEVINNFKTHA